MKIAIIGSRGYPSTYGGYETFVKELSERLVKKDIEVTVYCHRALYDVKPKKINGIELRYVAGLQTKSLSQVTHSFFSIIHACFSKADLLLVVNAANGPWGIFTRIFGKRAIINVDGIEWKRPKWARMAKAYFYFSAWLATKLYNKVVTDADAMKELYKKTFQADSTMIAYGANIRYSSHPELITKWNLERHEYYLIVGRLIPDNNADILLQGYIAADTKKKLVVVGDVPYADAFAASIKATHHPDIIFTGHIKEANILAELYHNCFAYLHGHEYGGTNPAMLKALAYGCAILALDTPFNKEMLDNGRYGIFFKKDIQSLSGKMHSLENNELLVSDMREKAREGITKKYNWDEITDNYISLFSEVMKQKNKTG
ncbi:MAG: Alpha-D-GlcNAc alpha,2-L-rhamnosyltransferase [Chitinophagaceae bacterium]|nr:Alpha-D-GlcNAc alpha,2-L-rhamnosyltransferase [Chitinophagaceae bacterium]